MGKTVYSRSGRNMPPHRPRTMLDREEVYQLGRQERSYRQIATALGLGPGTVVGRYRSVLKVRKRALGTEEATNPIVSECHRRRKSHVAFEARNYSLIQESGVFFEVVTRSRHTVV